MFHVDRSITAAGFRNECVCSLFKGMSITASALVVLMSVTFVDAAQQPTSSNGTEARCGMGPLRTDTSNPRYFIDGCAKAVYLTGSHTHLSFKDGGGRASSFDYEKYLDLMQANKHNFMRLWSGWELTMFQPLPWTRTGPGVARDGEKKFDLTQLDPGYFERLRARVLAARERNIYVSVMLFEGWLLRFVPDSAAQHPFDSANNINGVGADSNRDGMMIEAHSLNDPAVTAIQEAYVRKVVDTLNDLDNVLFEIANESAFPESVKWQYHMVDFIKKYEAAKPKQHPVGMSSAGFSSSHDDLNDLLESPADWISPGRPLTLAYDYLEKPPLLNTSKVILSDSDHLASELTDPSWIWKSVTRGVNPIFMDSYPPLDTLGSADVTAMRKNISYAAEYAEKMNLVLTAPRPDLSSTSYVLANPGVEYLIYQPGAGSFTVNLSSGQYQYEWFNPKTGSVAEAGTIAARGGNERFAPPFSGSAVLYLKSNAAPLG